MNINCAVAHQQSTSAIMLFGQSILFNVFGVVAAIVVAVIAYFKWQYTYWKRRGIPYVEPRIPFGTLLSKDGEVVHQGVLTREHYEEFKKKGARLGGLYIFDDPALLVTDLDYVKNVLVRDFNVFHNRGPHVDPKKHPVEANVAAVDGADWKKLRSKLTPTFSSGKIKSMFGTVTDCLVPLGRKLAALYQRNANVDIKDIVGCFTTDVMVSCSFGLDCNSLENEDSPFTEHARDFFKPRKWNKILGLLVLKFPFLKIYLRVSGMSTKARNFFVGVVRDTIKHRLSKNVKRNDFMEMMLQLMKNGELIMEEVFAQSFAFFIAGYETSAITSTQAFYLLAQHPDIQKKVREEIATVLARHGGKVTYESAHEMKYLDQVIAESQRVLPAATQIMRRCMQDYKFPNDDVIVKKGTLVAISIYGIHHDAEYYPDPEKFDPDRFSEENKANLVPFTHMPFGEGPRICIAARFALQLSKIAIIETLRSYNITLTKDTIEASKKDPDFAIKCQNIFLNLHKD